jgi:hypothetical protein
MAALVPRPRLNLIRYYVVFAPNSRFRARVTPAGRDKGRVAARRAPLELFRKTPAIPKVIGT